MESCAFLSAKPDEEKIFFLTHEDIDDFIGSCEEIVNTSVALDSGAVKSVLPVGDVLKGVRIGTKVGGDFHGAGGQNIENFGPCQTLCTDANGNQTLSNWTAAATTKALHSVSQIAGPEEHPTGLHDVMFNNKIGVIMPPGTLDKLLQTMKPVSEYKRRGDLYVTDVALSTFRRPGTQS